VVLERAEHMSGHRHTGHLGALLEPGVDFVGNVAYCSILVMS